MKLPALRRKFAQQVGEVNQMLGDQVADFASLIPLPHPIHRQQA